jgi:hypothetical protein
MTSNSPKAFFVEDGDRRFFIHRVPDEQLERSFFDTLVNDWVGNPPNYGVGPAALLWYSQNQLRFDDFNPLAPPPITEDKLDMIESSRHPVEDWLRTFPDSELFAARGREIYSLGELCMLCRTDGVGNSISPNSFGAYVRNVGMLKRIVRVNDKPVRLVAVKNVVLWDKSKGTAWQNELFKGETYDKKKF